MADTEGQNCKCSYFSVSALCVPVLLHTILLSHPIRSVLQMQLSQELLAFVLFEK